MLDIEGLSLSPADRDLLREPAVGGVILFTRNYESPEQIADLVDEIRALRSPPLLVAVDHEGGRVQRFRDGFTAIPPMRFIGREFDRNPESGLQAARQAGWLIASELRAVGVDLCFAPCVDLDWGISEIIGNRSFHRKADAVADLSNAFARGLRSAGMAAVAKHFPGHGAVIADSHLKLPVDRRDYGIVLDDMRPYERLVNNGAIAGVILFFTAFAAAAGPLAMAVVSDISGNIRYGFILATGFALLLFLGLVWNKIAAPARSRLALSGTDQALQG